MQAPVSGTSTRPRALRQRSKGPGAYAAYRAGAIRLEDVAGWSHSADWGRTPRVKSLRELVGKARGREFTRWGLALQQEEAATLRAAAQIAEQHGVRANYAGDAQVAELVTDGILCLRHDEWLPGQVSVDAEWFPAEVRRTRVASFEPAMNALLINPEQEYWRQSPTQRREHLQALFDVEVLSTNHPLHPVLHELAHSGHWYSSQAVYAALPATLTEEAKAIARRVSLRATISPKEFLAEVFVMRVLGRPLAEEVEALYIRLGGLSW